MSDKTKRKVDEACESSKRLARLANSIAEDVAKRDGVPLRPMSEDDSMVTSIENVISRAKRATGR